MMKMMKMMKIVRTNRKIIITDRKDKTTIQMLKTRKITTMKIKTREKRWPKGNIKILIKNRV